MLPQEQHCSQDQQVQTKMHASQQFSGKGLECSRQRDKKVWRGSLVCRMLDQPGQEPTLLLHRVQGDPVQIGEHAEGQRPERQENSDGPGAINEPDEDGGKNQYSQSNPGKEEPKLSGGSGLLKHQFENIVGSHDSRRVKADLGRVDMRVEREVGRGVAGFVYQAEAVLAECWRPVRLSPSAGTAPERDAHNKGKKQGPQSSDA